MDDLHVGTDPHHPHILSTEMLASSVSPISPTSLASQVGGHPGFGMTEDGSLVIKPATRREIEFYQCLASDETLAPLRPFVPTFYGTLTLEGRIDDLQPMTADVLQESDGSVGQLVLECLSRGFSKPNVMDIKLGTVLYDEYASPEKRARMEKAALETTSGETGMRITGFQVYSNDSAEPAIVPKTYGRSIKADQLSEGFARFFPMCTTTPSSSSGLPSYLLYPILCGLRDDITEIRGALTQVPLRMIGASLLIIYESDWARAEEALRTYGLINSNDGDTMPPGVEKDGTIPGGKINNSQYDAIVADEDESEDDDDDDDDDFEPPAPPYIVKLIDFAHTRKALGHFPADTGVIQGMDTVLGLLDTQISEIEVAASRS